jgi:transposase
VDAQTICERSQRPTMRFVEVTSKASQAAAVVFRARDLVVRQPPRIINALRRQLAESMSGRLPKAVRPVGVLIETLHLLDEKVAVLELR